MTEEPAQGLPFTVRHVGDAVVAIQCGDSSIFGCQNYLSVVFRYFLLARIGNWLESSRWRPEHHMHFIF
jgi:hypothetical protein